MKKVKKKIARKENFKKEKKIFLPEKMPPPPPAHRHAPQPADSAREIKRIWRLVLLSFAFLVATMIALAALQSWALSASNQKDFGVLQPFQTNTRFTILCTGPGPKSYLQGVLTPSPTLNSVGERVLTLTSNPASTFTFSNNQLKHVETGLYLAVSPTENSVICVPAPDAELTVSLFNKVNACMCKFNEFVLDFEEVRNSNEEVRGIASRRFQSTPNLALALLP
jgi:hypothetical protein